MRIVHVVDYFMPQFGYQEPFLAKWQLKMGHEVYVVTGDRYCPGIARIGPSKGVRRGGFFVEEGILV